MSTETDRYGTTSPGNRSAAEIERDVERTRARLTGTVEELRDRVSPNQLADQAVDWLRGSGGREFLGNLGATVRDNPMPVLLMAAGIGWLAMSGGRQERHARVRSYTREGLAPPVGESQAGAYEGEIYGGGSYPPETYAGRGLSEDAGPSIGQRASEAAGGLRHRAEDAAGRAGQAWHEVGERAHGLAEGASEQGRRLAERAGEAWHSATDRASGYGQGVAQYGQGTGQRLVESFQSQPLLLGALGFALGAAAGSLIPHSEAEDRLMGESRDRMANRLSSLAGEAYRDARDTANEQVSRASETLGEAYGRTRDRVAGSGLSASEGATALGEVARDLREAVEKTAHDVGAAVREGAHEAKDEAERKESEAERKLGKELGGKDDRGKAEFGKSDPGKDSLGKDKTAEARNRGTGGSATGMPPSRSGPQSGGPV